MERPVLHLADVNYLELAWSDAICGCAPGWSTSAGSPFVLPPKLPGLAFGCPWVPLGPQLVCSWALLGSSLDPAGSSFGTSWATLVAKKMLQIDDLETSRNLREPPKRHGAIEGKLAPLVLAERRASQRKI